MTVDRGKTDTDPEATQESGQRAYDAGRASVPSTTAEYPQVTSRDADERDDVEPRERTQRDAPVRDDRSGLFTRGMRGLFWLVATIGLVLALVVGAQSVGWLPEFKNPFKEQTTDRSQPPLLQSIQDLSRYVAAEGNFQVIIDVQQNQKYVPDFLVNDRVLFVAAGTVESYVDFGNIGSGALKESADRRSVEVTLPAPQLGKPNLDPDRSEVYSRDRGLINRVRDVFKDDPSRMQEVYKIAEERLAAAATESGLRERAQENTTKMLEGLLKSLGYTAVTVKYQAP